MTNLTLTETTTATETRPTRPARPTRKPKGKMKKIYLWKLIKRGFKILSVEEEDYFQSIGGGSNIILQRGKEVKMLHMTSYGKVTKKRDQIWGDYEANPQYIELPKFLAVKLIHGVSEDGKKNEFYRHLVAKKLNGRYACPGAGHTPLCKKGEKILVAYNRYFNISNNYLIVPEGTTNKKVEWAFLSGIQEVK